MQTVNVPQQQGLAAGLLRNWARFWFDPVDPLPLGLFRAVFCLGLACFYLARQFDYTFLFSDKGSLPYPVLVANLPDTPMIPWRVLVGDTPGPWLHALLLVGLVCLGLGWIGRRLAWAVFILHLAFIDRNPLILYGPDFVATFWLAYLCLTRSNQVFRLTPLTPLKSASPPVAGGLTTTGVRLIQVQLCLIYAYSGLDKLRGASWREGTAIWQTLSNGLVTTVDFGFLADFPTVLMVLTFTTMLWEVSFPLLIAIRPIRPYSLAFGVLLHLGIGVVLHLPFFALFMVAPYVLFLDAKRLRSILESC